jgi:hypothetical protein
MYNCPLVSTYAPPPASFSKIYRDYQLCGEEVLAEELNVAEGSKGIEGVIVSLEGITKGKAKPKEEEVVIENRGCRFVHMLRPRSWAVRCKSRTPIPFYIQLQRLLVQCSLSHPLPYSQTGLLHP